MMKGGESGSTRPAPRGITKKGAPTHSSSSSTATGVGHGNAGVRERLLDPGLARQVVHREDAAARGWEAGDQPLASRSPPRSSHTTSTRSVSLE